MENQNQQTQTSPQPSSEMSSSVNSLSKSKIIPIILGVVIVAIIAIGAYLLGTKQSQPVVQNSIQTTPIPSPTPDPTANWKTYTNLSLDFSFKYPIDFGIVKENPQEVKFNGPFIDLTVSAINLNNYKSTKLCSQIVENEQLPCIDDYKGWNQKEPITATKLDNIDAVSYYLQGRPDYAYHVVQTTTQPIIELKMSVAGGGLDKTFDQILSTFRFSN